MHPNPCLGTTNLSAPRTTFSMEEACLTGFCDDEIHLMSAAVKPTALIRVSRWLALGFGLWHGYHYNKVLFERETYWRQHGNLGYLPLLGPLDEELEKRAKHRMNKYGPPKGGDRGNPALRKKLGIEDYYKD